VRIEEMEKQFLLKQSTHKNAHSAAGGDHVGSIKPEKSVYRPSTIDHRPSTIDHRPSTRGVHATPGHVPVAPKVSQPVKMESLILTRINTDDGLLYLAWRMAPWDAC